MRNSLKLLGGTSLLLLCVSVPAQAGEWVFPVGLTYVNGFRDVVDYYEDIIGADIDFAVPAGISFHPHYEFAPGHQIWIDVGPASFVLMEVIGPGTNEEYDYFNLPIGVGYGFAFLRNAAVTPYARVGARYHLVTGDFTESSSVGYLAAIGLETGRRKAVGFGFELAYDDAKIEMVRFRREEIKAGGFQVSFRIVF